MVNEKKLQALQKESGKAIAKRLYMPPEIYHNLLLVAVRVGVPVETVTRAAFWAFAGIEPRQQRQLVLNFWYRGNLVEKVARRGWGPRGLVRSGITTLCCCLVRLRAFFGSRRPM